MDMNTLGTTGFPVFGPAAIPQTRKEAYNEVEKALNVFISTFKTYVVPGNEVYFNEACLLISQAWGLGGIAVTGLHKGGN